jgi:hypothetical protein
MANTYEAIATVTVGSGGEASIDFTNIPQTFTDLVIRASVRNNAGATIRNSNLRVNSNSSAIYSERVMDGNGSAVGSASSGGTNVINWGGLANDALSTVNTFSNFEIYIPNYTSSNNKSISVDAVAENNGTFGQQRLSASLAATSSAITSVNIIGEANFLQYSTATLYGIKNS